MKRIILITTSVLILQTTALFAAITSIVVTPASPTTLSNGNSYYLAGKQYTFVVQATDPLASAASDWDYLDLFIENGANNIQVRININGGETVSIQSGDSSIVPGTINSSTGYSTITYSIPITIAWDTDEFAALATSDVSADVKNILDPVVTDTQTFNFGLCSSFRVINFTQDGVAADGYVNPWHITFNVSGSIIYNVTGAGVGDTVDSIADLGANEIIGNTTLIFNPSTTNDPCATDANEVGGVSYAVGPQYINTTLGAGYGGTHQWAVRANLATGTITEDSANTLPIICDQIEITDIIFSGGGGTTPPADTYYYRSTNIPGTQVQINAQRAFAGTGMVGLTTIALRNDDGFVVDVDIANGATSGTAVLPNPTVLPAPGTTDTRTYEVLSITGSAFDDEQNIGTIPGSITQNTTDPPIIYWDNNDPPGINGAPGVGKTPFSPLSGFTSGQTAFSFTLNWAPLTNGGPDYDADFYTYRIYYRESRTCRESMADS